MISWEDVLNLKSFDLKYKNSEEIYIPEEIIGNYDNFYFTVEISDANKKKYTIRTYAASVTNKDIKYREEEYKDGKRHGKYISFWKDGSICSQQEHKNGKRCGKGVTYDKKGNIVWKFC